MSSLRGGAGRVSMLMTLVVSSAALGTDYYVSTATGTDSATCGAVASPCKTVNYTFSRFSPAPTQANPAVVHVAPGTYTENGGPMAALTGFVVPNHTHLISDQGAAVTTLSLDLSYFPMYPNGVLTVVRGQQIGIGQNAENITIDGFTITVPGGEIAESPLGLVGINLGAAFSTPIAPRNNVVTNNIISLRTRYGTAGLRGEGTGIQAGGGIKIDCNVFRNIDTVGITMSCVDNASDGTNATLPAEVTRNWFYNFTNMPVLPDGGVRAGDDEYLAIGVRMPTTVRGNHFDFSRPTIGSGEIIDRRFSIVCFDCTGLVVQNNLFTGVAADNGATLALVTQTPVDGGMARYAPLFDHNTIADSWVGIQAFDVPSNGRGGDNFAPLITNNVLWTDAPARDFSNGTYSYNNALSSTSLMGVSNISMDPRFVNPGTGDYRLGAGSPSLTGAQGGGQQGAYGGATPFGAGASAPNRACVLRGSPCVGLANGTPCGNGVPMCASATALSSPSCQQEVCSASSLVQVSCNDGNACTQDTCAAGVGCVHTPSCADGGVDAGSVDAGLPDAGGTDAGRADAGGVDAGRIDGGGMDAGPIDAGAVDAGEVDGGDTDGGSGEIDAGSGESDAGYSGVDGGSPADGGGSGAGGGAGGELVIGTCGCTSSSGAPIGLLLGLAALWRKGRARPRRFLE